MLPAEAMNRAISKVTGKRYENIKIAFDVFYIVAAAAITLVFLGELKGVREGSIIAAFAVGSIMKVFTGFLTDSPGSVRGRIHDNSTHLVLGNLPGGHCM